jgi:hypothetical protein
MDGFRLSHQPLASVFHWRYHQLFYAGDTSGLDFRPDFSDLDLSLSGIVEKL